MLYVFVTNSIINVGGAQIYCANKQEFLKKSGNKVCVISTLKGEIQCSGLVGYSTGIFCQLRFPPYFYSDRQKEKIVNEIAELIRSSNPDNEEILIESHMINLAMWSDLLAKKLCAKHLFMDITEGYFHFSPVQKEYLLAKRELKTIYSNGNKSFDKLLGSDSDMQFCPSFAPVVHIGPIDSELQERFTDMRGGADYLIGSIGRIEKPFVMNMIRETAEYIKKDTEHTYRFVFIGDSHDKRAKKRAAEYLKKSGIDFAITGFMYPISSKLIKQFDLFLSSAGATNNSAECMVPTIVYSAFNYEPIGYYQGGKTSMYSSGDKNVFDSLVKTALENKGMAVFEENAPQPLEYYEQRFVGQIKLFENVPDGDTVTLKSALSGKEKIMRFIVSTFGYKCAMAAFKVYSVLKGMM